jgi:hypothetical protein
MAIATGTGKKSAKTGISRVPRPNPERKVTTATPRAARGMTIYSNGINLWC